MNWSSDSHGWTIRTLTLVSEPWQVRHIWTLRCSGGSNRDSIVTGLVSKCPQWLGHSHQWPFWVIRSLLKMTLFGLDFPYLRLQRCDLDQTSVKMTVLTSETRFMTLSVIKMTLNPLRNKRHKISCKIGQKVPLWPTYPIPQDRYGGTSWHDCALW